MARTRRGVIDELGGYDQLHLDGETPPEQDYYQFPDTGTAPIIYTVWGTGLVSFGPATDAQIAFMANLSTTTDLSAFPGDFVAIGFSAEQYGIIEYWTGGFWVRAGGVDVLITNDGISVRGVATDGLQVGWALGGQPFTPGSGTVFWSDFNIIAGTTAGEILSGTDAAETINGLGGHDLLVGGAGSDALDGGAGNDYLYGGEGNDRLWGGEGNDILNPGVPGPFEVFRLGFGSLEAQPVDGGPGFDTLQLDYSASGISYPAYGESLVFSADQFLSGDAVTGVEAVDITGTQYVDVISGTSFNDRLLGGGGFDVLEGGAGDDLLDAGAAGPSVVGGIPAGGATVDDAVSIDHLFTTGSGTSTLSLSVTSPARFLQETHLQEGGTEFFSFTVSEAGSMMWINYNVEEFSEVFQFGILGFEENYDPAVPYVFPHAGTYYLGISIGDNNYWDSGNIVLDIAFESANVLTENRLYGGTGDDTYVVYSASDQAIENSGEGSDTVRSSVSYAIGAHVEKLTLTGTAAINGTGNALANVITGNEGANQLLGNAGADRLFGNAGNDTLDGGGGEDKLYGGAGDDILVIDNAGDATVELAGEGTDLVRSSITHTLKANIENLTLTGAAALNGTGNALGNALTGNAAVNRLYGLGGDDRLDGGGGGGEDKFYGSTGNDVYVVDSSGDATVELAGEGTDLVEASVTHTLKANVENLILTGNLSTFGTGNALANIITGNSGANRLIGLDGDDTLFGNAGVDRLYGDNGSDLLDGGSGGDKLYGGAGDDIYIVDSSGDATVELLNEGIDLVQSSVTHTLKANIENLELTGAANLNGTGNGLANLLTGNSGSNVLSGLGGNDTLDGGAGRDTMHGGLGADIFAFDETGFAGLTTATCDVIGDFSQAGGDTIRLSDVDADSGTGGDQGFAFIGGAAFSGTAGQLRYQQIDGNTYVQGDTNGDSIADFMIRLDGLHTLASGDFAF